MMPRALTRTIQFTMLAMLGGCAAPEPPDDRPYEFDAYAECLDKMGGLGAMSQPNNPHNVCLKVAKDTYGK